MRTRGPELETALKSPPATPDHVATSAGKEKEGSGGDDVTETLSEMGFETGFHIKKCKISCRWKRSEERISQVNLIIV